MEIAEGKGGHLSEDLFGEYVGRKIGGCLISQRVGGGGMGVVFEARHLALNKRVALKLLLPALAADKTFVKRFVSEARMSAQIEHPNVVQVLNVGRDGEIYFMVMQFIEGQSLRERMGAGPVPPPEAAGIVMQVARGLAAAHGRGIVHRDVKPENILLGADGVARVVDLGLSKSLSTEDSAMLTAPGTAMGTPNYISPEQATEARAVDARADIYSLGATFYHLLSGAPPFSGPSAFAIMTKHISEPLPPLATRNAGVPADLGSLVDRMMAKDPAERFQTMDEVVAALQGYLDGVTSAVDTLPAMAAAPTAQLRPTKRVPGAPPPAAKAGGRRWPFVALGAAGTLGVVIFLAILSTAGDPGRKALAAAQTYERLHPRDFAGSRERYGKVREEFPDTRWDAKAATAAQELEKRLLAEGEKARQDLDDQTKPLEAAGQWKESARLWATFPPEFAETPAGEQAAARHKQARAEVAWTGQRDKANQLLKARNWKGLEKLAAAFPTELADTRRGCRVGEIRTKAHVAGRARILMIALPLKTPAARKKVNDLCDPRVRIKLGIRRVAIGMASKFTSDVRSPQLVGPDKALVPVMYHITHRGPQSRKDDSLEIYVWERIKGKWYVTDVHKPGEDGPAPRRGPGIRRRNK